MVRSSGRPLDNPRSHGGDRDDDTRAALWARFDRQIGPDGRGPLAHHLEADVAGRAGLGVESTTVVLDSDRDTATIRRYLYAKRLGVRVMCRIRACLLHDAKELRFRPRRQVGEAHGALEINRHTKPVDEILDVPPEERRERLARVGAVPKRHHALPRLRET